MMTEGSLCCVHPKWTAVYWWYNDFFTFGPFLDSEQMEVRESLKDPKIGVLGYTIGVPLPWAYWCLVNETEEFVDGGEWFNRNGLWYFQPREYWESIWNAHRRTLECLLPVHDSFTSES